MRLFRIILFGSVVMSGLSSLGCTSETPEAKGQASPDLRSNLEDSTKAAADAAKEKPKAE